MASAASVFYIDGHPGRAAVARVLREAGFAVAALPTGQEALERLGRGERAELAILGSEVPDVGAVELCRRLRQSPGGAAAAVLHLYAPPLSEGQQRHVAEAADECCLAATAEPAALLAMVRALLRGQRAQAALHATHERLERMTQDHRTFEAQLLRMNETLEQRVAERTAEAAIRTEQLRALADELTRAEQRERRRLAQVLHDHLQQVLVAAKMQAAMLGQQAGPGPLREAAQALGRLVGEGIEMSRSLTVELSPPVLYEGTLATAMRWLGQRMEEKQGLAVALEADADADAAEEVRVLLFQAVRELLFNIVKHGAVKAARLVIEPIEGDRVQVIVEDQGKGFDPEAAARRRPARGGFGLFSIHERLELIGGTMSVASAPGRGTRITLVAPSHRPRAGEERPEGAGDSAAPESAQPIRVVIADDHKILREGLAGLLHDHPEFEIVGQASDGQAAVELTRRLRPDVVVMDLTMPGISGIEATRRIKAERAEVKVIGLSMHEKDDMAAAMLKAGASGYLTKDGAAESLVGAIRKAMAAQPDKVCQPL